MTAPTPPSPPTPVYATDKPTDQVPTEDVPTDEVPTNQPADESADESGDATDTATGSGSDADSGSGAAEPSESATDSGAPTTTAAPQTLAPMDKVAVAALQTALAAEHAALWAYGLVAAHAPTDAATITTMIEAHQTIRDSTADLIVQGGGTPVGPAPAYTTPKPVTDVASARDLAITVEEDCAAAWRSVIGATDDRVLRGLALNTLTDVAQRLVTWRTVAKINPVTTAFPGQTTPTS